MCSAIATDLTTRARIRDAAILRFGQDGFEAASIRAIAKDAGVSPALVIHHFGSKAGLRHACDDYVTGELVDAEDEAAESDLIGTMHRWLSEPGQFQPAFDYLTRMLAEESPASDRLFDDLVARTERSLSAGVAAGKMRTSSDPTATALLLAVQGLALLTMSRHVSRTLGSDSLSAAILQRLTVPTLELYTNGLYTGSAMLQAAKQAAEGVPE